MVHVVTVGTSILGRYGHKRDAAVPPEADLVAFVKRDPSFASAELNAMSAYLNDGSVSQVYLLATDTADGTLCANVIQQYLRTRDKPVQVENGPRIPGVGGPSFYEGMGRLASRITRYVREHSEQGVMINATGGYKAEAALVAAVGFWSGVPVYYRHETADRTVVLPPIGLASGETAAAIRDIRSPDGRVIDPEFATWRAAHGSAWHALLQGFAVEALQTDGEIYGCKLTDLGRFFRTFLEEIDA